MQQRILLLFFYLFINSFTQMKAQDMSFSQFFANKIALNPAYAVTAPGTNIYLITRDQWLNVPDQPFSFVNSHLSFSTEIADRFHGGMDISATSEGEGYLRNFNCGVVSGYFLPLQKEANSENIVNALSMGVKGSYNIQSIDWSKLVFSDQIDPVLGQNSNTSQAIPPISERKSYLDLDLGFLYEQSVSKYGFFEAGLNIQHLLTPETSIQNLQAKLPMHFTIHGSGSFCLNKYTSGGFVFLAPSFKADLQDVARARLSSFSIGTNLIFAPSTIAGRNPKNSYNTMFTGVYLHSRYLFPDIINTAACTFLIGSKIKRDTWNLETILSYDFNIGGLNHSNTFGVVELSFIFGHDSALMDLLKKEKKNNKKRNKTNKCPSWGDNSYART